MASSQFEPVREIEEQHETMLDSFLGRGTRHALFRGRPDIVIELYDSEGRKNLTDVVLGEIKYTDSQQTFSKGLEELLSYLEFAQRDCCLSDFDVDCQGVLITDGVETDVPTSADGRITHIQAADLQSEDVPTGWFPEFIQPVTATARQEDS